MNRADAQLASLRALTTRRCAPDMDMADIACGQPAVQAPATETEASDIASIPFVPIGATADRQFQFFRERMVHSGRKRQSRRIYAIRCLGKEGDIPSRATGRSRFACAGSEQDAAHRNGG